MMRFILIIAVIWWIPNKGFAKPQYFISGLELQITLESDKSINDSFVIDMLADTLVRSCTSMVIGGSFNNIPEGLSSLKQIEYIEINSTKPISLETSFSGFSNLKYLMIFTPVNHINEKIILDNLLELSIYDSRLNYFPIAVCNWLTLNSVDIQNGQFSEIPREIKQLHKLERLNLSSNNIKKLPKELYSLELLKYIGLENNDLLEISSEICCMKSLDEIYLDGNTNLSLSLVVKDCLLGKIVTR